MITRLIFADNSSDGVVISKEGRKWIYFVTNTSHNKYRVDKETGIVQVSPYWNTLKKLRVEIISKEV